jgi:serine phosphatase RsbU (regulator of sigma subunit)
MDGILLKFGVTGNKIDIEYAAANNAPVLVGPNGITELPFDKMPVGNGVNQAAFKTYGFQHTKGDMLYLLTDGFADQFGGDRGKKYKFKNLAALLQHISDLPVEDQQRKLAEELQRWKGDLEQVDDVCIIGIRL